MTTSVKPIPTGFHSITPHLVVRGASDAIAFYKRVFGAQEIALPAPDGKRLIHALIQIGDSKVFLVDEFPEWGSCAAATEGGRSVTLNLYVEDADATFARAVAAGAQPKMPPADMFWGDRYSQIVDPFGQEWSIATRKEDLSPAELKARQDAFFSQTPCQPAS